jgi:phospholipase/lecithinase/hemolysin
MDVLVRTYLGRRSPAPDELFVLWGGTNDFFLGQTNPTLPVEFIKSHVLALASAGARNFLVVNLPKYFGNSSLNRRLTQHAEAFNSLLSSALYDVRSTQPELEILELDYFSLFERVRANPAEFGFENVIDPACRNCVSANRTVVPNPDAYFFWDDVHPTAAAHRLIADAAYAILAVPEPGDFNQDGSVDAADYVVWRNGLGGTYTQNDYLVWSANFALTVDAADAASSDASLPSAPEPSGAFLLMIGAGLCCNAFRCGICRG